MAVIGYSRVSTSDQDTAAQRHSIEARYNVERWFSDDAISGATKAASRPGFAKLLDFVRDGDTVVVAAIDRLGRNTIDVLETVETLQGKGATIISQREGFDLSTPIGKAMLTMLAAVGELERSNIKARQMAGIERSRAEGKHLGRPSTIDQSAVRAWRQAQQASIKATADHFGISPASVKRACAAAP
ncbi:MAG: recombinase family protein [Pseudomonadota bacterium]